jgi:FkbM family methyltransferase
MKIRPLIISKLLLLIEDLFFYPKLKKHLSTHIDDNSIIFDVGANNGQSIRFFRSISQNAKIFSFEPNPTLFKYLQQQFHSDSRIELNQSGVSNLNGELVFQINQLDLTSSFQKLNFNSTYLKKKAAIIGVKAEDIISEKIMAPVIQLKHFIKENNINVIDLIKIDTEGHEYECLQGLFAPLLNEQFVYIKRIQIENHHDDMYENQVPFEKINELLKSNKFIEERRIKHPFGNFFEIIYVNQDETKYSNTSV